MRDFDAILCPIAYPASALDACAYRQRSAMYVVDGVVKVMQVSEAEDDPAGDARPEASCVENMLKLISEL